MLDKALVLLGSFTFSCFLTMKVKSLLLLFLFHFSDAYNCAGTSLASCAIDNILVQYYAKNADKVDVINYGSDGKNEKLIDELLRNKNDSIAFQVSKSSAENYWKTKLNISSILMFDSPENFKAVSRNITWVSDVRKRSKNLVFIRNATISDIVGIENEFSIDSTSFLLNDDGKSIELVASYMFTPRACRSSRLTTINRFFMDKMSWESSKIFPRKYRNMYNCKLIAGDSTSGSGSFDGWNIIKTLSKIYNFKVELKIFNTTAWRSIKAPQIADVDLIMKIDSHAGFVQSVTFHTMGFSFAHPQGELYTQVEKMEENVHNVRL